MLLFVHKMAPQKRNRHYRSCRTGSPDSQFVYLLPSITSTQSLSNEELYKSQRPRSFLYPDFLRPYASP